MYQDARIPHSRFSCFIGLNFKKNFEAKHEAFNKRMGGPPLH